MEELAHAVMGTEKSHYLLPVNGRPRKAGGVICSESEGQRTRGADDANPSEVGEDEKERLNSSN